MKNEKDIVAGLGEIGMPSSSHSQDPALSLIMT